MGKNKINSHWERSKDNPNYVGNTPTIWVQIIDLSIGVGSPRDVYLKKR